MGSPKLVLTNFVVDFHMQSFSLLDGDNDGYITLSDLQKYAPKIGLTSGDIKEMIAEADEDGDGKISKREFLHIMKQTNLFLTT